MTAVSPAGDANKPFAYDEVPYPKMPHRETHPRYAQTLATLFGMTPAALAGARVLELGCAGGANLLPQAIEFPQAEFVGIDLAKTQIDDARRSAAQLSLRNVDFRHGSIMDIDERWGKFDYIICHGVYSWVPAMVQKKILEVARTNLRTQGVAMVSYNTFPGWHFRGTLRDVLNYHTANLPDPKVKISQARALVSFLAENCPEQSAYGQLMKEELNLLRNSPDAYLYHEHLEENNRPCYFHQFMSIAQEAGLQFLGETKLSAMLSQHVPQKAREQLKNIPLVQFEQYMDFLRNQSFRKTLLVHKETELVRTVPQHIMKQMHFGLGAKPAKDQVIQVEGDGELKFQVGTTTISCQRPLVKAALQVMSENYPRCLSFSQLHMQALERLPESELATNDPQRLGDNTIASLLSTMLGSGAAEAFVTPPSIPATISSTPRASALMRMQASEGPRVTNTRHEFVSIDELGRHLLLRLDGRHDRQALAGMLSQSVKSGQLCMQKNGEHLAALTPQVAVEIVGDALKGLQSLGLLVD